jgi:hypothetical protein
VSRLTPGSRRWPDHVLPTRIEGPSGRVATEQGPSLARRTGCRSVAGTASEHRRRSFEAAAAWSAVLKVRWPEVPSRSGAALDPSGPTKHPSCGRVRNRNGLDRSPQSSTLCDDGHRLWPTLGILLDPVGHPLTSRRVRLHAAASAVAGCGIQDVCQPRSQRDGRVAWSGDHRRSRSLGSAPGWSRGRRRGAAQNGGASLKSPPRSA